MGAVFTGIVAFFAGALFGTIIMAIVQINRGEDDYAPKIETNNAQE